MDTEKSRDAAVKATAAAEAARRNPQGSKGSKENIRKRTAAVIARMQDPSRKARMARLRGKDSRLPKKAGVHRGIEQVGGPEVGPEAGKRKIAKAEGLHTRVRAELARRKAQVPKMAGRDPGTERVSTPNEPKVPAVGGGPADGGGPAAGGSGGTASGGTGGGGSGGGRSRGLVKTLARPFGFLSGLRRKAGEAWNAGVEKGIGGVGGSVGSRFLRNPKPALADKGAGGVAAATALSVMGGGAEANRAKRKANTDAMKKRTQAGGRSVNVGGQINTSTQPTYDSMAVHLLEAYAGTVPPSRNRWQDGTEISYDRMAQLLGEAYIESLEGFDKKRCRK